MGKAILLLYEGESEGEFFPPLLKSKIIKPNARILHKCYHGVYNANGKVVNHILDALRKLPNTYLYVFIQIDRDGRKPTEPQVDVDEIAKKVNSKWLKPIKLIISTQDFESWLFIDVENIYEYLKAPKSKRNIGKYKNHESFHNGHLSNLFKQFGRYYAKGKKSTGFIASLDTAKIYESCNDLKDPFEELIRVSK